MQLGDASSPDINTTVITMVIMNTVCRRPQSFPSGCWIQSQVRASARNGHGWEIHITMVELNGTGVMNPAEAVMN